MAAYELHAMVPNIRENDVTMRVDEETGRLIVNLRQPRQQEAMVTQVYAPSPVDCGCPQAQRQRVQRWWTLPDGVDVDKIQARLIPGSDDLQELVIAVPLRTARRNTWRSLLIRNGAGQTTSNDHTIDASELYDDSIQRMPNEGEAEDVDVEDTHEEVNLQSARPRVTPNNTTAKASTSSSSKPATSSSSSMIASSSSASSASSSSNQQQSAGAAASSSTGH